MAGQLAAVHPKGLESVEHIRIDTAIDMERLLCLQHHPASPGTAPTFTLVTLSLIVWILLWTIQSRTTMTERSSSTYSNL